jgi:hypothetical protein
VPLDRVRLTTAKSGFRRHRKLRFARPQGSDSGSALEDDELCMPDPRARTRAQPQKTTNSASPDPRARTRAQTRKTTNSASPDPRAWTQPWPQPTVSTSPDPGARTRPRPRKTDSTSTSEEPPHRPTQGTDRPRQQEAPSLPYPELTQATGNKTGVPSGSLRQTSNDGTPHAL